MQKEVSEFLVNGKNTMPVSAVKVLKGHRGRARLRVFDPTGGTKAAFTAERNKFHVAAVSQIMKENGTKRKPQIPLMNEGLGELRCRRHFS